MLITSELTIVLTMLATGLLWKIYVEVDMTTLFIITLRTPHRVIYQPLLLLYFVSMIY